MKYVFMLFVGLCLSATAVFAQDTLQQYTGKYKFGDGSPVADVTVTLADGALTMNSSAGSSPLRHESGDLFTITAFNGTASFGRSAERKINSVHIEAMGYVMDGTKEEGGFAWLKRARAVPVGVCERKR
jgi:hypothetical protein